MVQVPISKASAGSQMETQLYLSLMFSLFPNPQEVLLPHSEMSKRDFISSIPLLLQSTRFDTCLVLGNDYSAHHQVFFSHLQVP